MLRLLGKILGLAWRGLQVVDLLVGLGLAGVIVTLILATVENVRELALGWQIVLVFGLVLIFSTLTHFLTWLFAPRIIQWRQAEGSGPPLTAGGVPPSVAVQHSSVVIQQVGSESTTELRNPVTKQPELDNPDPHGAPPPWASRPWVRSDQYGNSKFNRQTLRLVDIADRNFRIKSRDFEECDIEGPAVVAFLGKGVLLQCSFDGDEETLFWVVAEDKKVIGAIATEDCNFTRCNFRGIGVVGTREQVAMFIEALGGSKRG